MPCLPAPAASQAWWLTSLSEKHAATFLLFNVLLPSIFYSKRRRVRREKNAPVEGTTAFFSCALSLSLSLSLAFEYAGKKRFVSMRGYVRVCIDACRALRTVSFVISTVFIYSFIPASDW